MYVNIFPGTVLYIFDSIKYSSGAAASVCASSDLYTQIIIVYKALKITIKQIHADNKVSSTHRANA